MDFFGNLRQAAYNKFKGIYDERSSPPYSDGYMCGVTATIEALKETTVGEPVGAILVHVKDFVVSKEGEFLGRLPFTHVTLRHPLKGRHGTDGEEATVIVFKQK